MSGRSELLDIYIQLKDIGERVASLETEVKDLKNQFVTLSNHLSHLQNNMSTIKSETTKHTLALSIIKWIAASVSYVLINLVMLKILALI